jgi:hypothetical protein
MKWGLKLLATRVRTHLRLGSTFMKAFFISCTLLSPVGLMREADVSLLDGMSFESRPCFYRLSATKEVAVSESTTFPTEIATEKVVDSKTTTREKW